MNSLRKVLLFIFVPVGILAQSPDASREHEVALKRMVTEMVQGYPVQTEVAVGIVNDNKVSFFGFRKGEKQIEAIDNAQSVFEIGSVTKVFTATLLAQYVLDSKVSLDDEIADYLDISLHGDPRITFKQLANHTSGLPRLPSNFDQEVSPDNPYKDYGEELLIQYLTNDLHLNATSELCYEYSNLGMGLLGYILTETAGDSYAKLLQRNLFDKYGMSNSVADHKKVMGMLVSGLDRYGSPSANWDLGILQGAGSVLSTVTDLTRFMEAHFDPEEKALALSRKTTYTLNRISDIALGWEVIKRRSGDAWFKHGGRTGGYTSAFLMDVDHETGVVILSNISGYHPKCSGINDLAFKLMNTITKNQL